MRLSDLNLGQNSTIYYGRDYSTGGTKGKKTDYQMSREFAKDSKKSGGRRRRRNSIDLYLDTEEFRGKDVSRLSKKDLRKASDIESGSEYW